LGRSELLAGAGLVVLGLVLYRHILASWISDLWIDPNYSHGLLVPFVSAWLVYERRDRLAKLTVRPAASAIPLVVTGVLLLAMGLLAAELFTTRLSFLVLITGFVAFNLGWAFVRALALPLGFLLFMVPLPTLVLNAVSLPLQFVASQYAVSVLQAIGIPALREGNVVMLPNVSLEVVEACSGIHSLVSLGAVAVLLAALTLRRAVPRLLLVASSILIAVLTNGARVAGTGILSYHFGAAAAEGFFHEFSGWVIFVAALGLLGLEAGVLRRLERS
jgi:exosortase